MGRTLDGPPAKGYNPPVPKGGAMKTPMTAAPRSLAASALALLVGAGAGTGAAADGAPAAPRTIHEAARRGDLPAIRARLAEGADIDGRSFYGWTPLIEAVAHGQTDAAVLLIEQGADVKARDTVRIQRYNVKDPAHIEDFGYPPDSGNWSDKLDRTALHYAARHGHESLMRLLLGRGADPLATGLGGETPLDEATDHRERNAARILRARIPWHERIAAHIPHAMNTMDTPFVRITAKDGHEELIPTVLGREANITIALLALLDHRKDGTDVRINGWMPLPYAARHGFENLVLELLERGFDIDAPHDPYGHSPLEEAAASGHLDIVRILLDKGANVNPRHKMGGPALHYAAYNGLVEVARLLLDRGADPEVKRASTGSKALHLAVDSGNEDTARALLDKGADPNALGRNGNTPLHTAGYNGRLNMARLLMDKGADVNIQAKDGDTPLHEAAVYGHVDIVLALLDRGARIETTNGRGMTPLHYAGTNRNRDIALALLDKGADPNVQDKSGWMPSDYAFRDRRNDVARLLREWRVNPDTESIAAMLDERKGIVSQAVDVCKS